MLIGLTGIGGGSLMTPLLLIVVGTQPHVAVGTDIAYGALTKTVGGWQHLRNGTVDLGVSLWLAIGSVPGSVGGVILVESLPSPPDEALLWGVAGRARVDGVVTLGRALFVPRVAEREREIGPADAAREGARAVVLGLVLGFILGVTSVGSGALIGLALILDLPPHASSRRRHRRVPRGRAAVGGRARAHRRGQRRLRPHGEHPGRVDARACSSGERLARARPGRRACGRRWAARCSLPRSASASKAGLDLPAAAIIGPPVVAGVLAYAIARSRRRRERLAPAAAQPT